jgi:hypothetical protein
MVGNGWEVHVTNPTGIPLGFTAIVYWMPA